jgi:predicted DNA binding CopG/RHH family protein
MKQKLDKEEKKIWNDFEKGKFKSVANVKSEMEQSVRAAKNYLRKDERINIRVSSTDLDMIKRKAAEEAIPYQTLITSVLHKFIMGRLKVN